MSKVDWAGKTIDQVLDFVSIALLLSICILTLIQVFLRYFVRVPFIWSEEFIRFLFVWFIWLGAVLGIPRGMHMVIEYFRDTIFSGKKGLAVKFILEIAALLFLAVVVVKGWSLATSLTMEYHTTFPVSVMYKYLASPVCGGFMLFYLLLQLRMTWKELRAGTENS